MLDGLVNWGRAIGRSAIGAEQMKVQRQINQQNIDLSREQMYQQRQWALEDWDKVNQYNSPAQQMQRYKEAGFNPHLIYGSAANSPAAMVRTTSTPAPQVDSRGLIEGANQMGAAVGDIADAYIRNKMLENDTMVKQAQVLNLQAQAEKNSLGNDLTRQTWDDIVTRIKQQNSIDYQKFNMLTAQLTNMPSADVAFKMNEAKLEGIILKNKHTAELFNLAKQEGKLKQADIDLMENLAGVRGGDKMIAELLKQLVYGGLRKWAK